LTIVTFGENKMNAVKMLAVVLIVAGSLGLMYGGFSYTKETHQTKIGPIELSVKDTERVNVPIWAGVAALVAGVILLVARK
jgi:multidrug transporter EmrE-like cation transporter